MRHLFLSAAATARTLLDVPETGRRWHAPSALPQMTIGALSAHLARAVTLVPGYLDSTGEPPFADAPAYFLTLLPHADPDPDSNAARAVRTRAVRDAGTGPAGIARSWDRARSHLEGRLAADDPQRGISVPGSVMRLEDYLVTRMVELVVHSDDLAASLDVSPPDFDPPVTRAVLSCITEMAARRRSALEVIRAMCRVERGDPTVLRVF